MTVIDPGHEYALANFTHPEETQHVVFVKKIQYAPGGPLDLVWDGTTNEEVLRMLIERMEWLQGKLACEENRLVIIRLYQSLALLEERTDDRKRRHVEGTPKE